MSGFMIPVLLGVCLLLIGQIAVLKNFLQPSHVMSAFKGFIALVLVIMVAVNVPDKDGRLFMAEAAWLIPVYIVFVYALYLITHPRVQARVDRLFPAKKKSKAGPKSPVEVRKHEKPPFTLTRDPEKPRLAPRDIMFVDLYAGRKVVRINGEVDRYLSKYFAADIQRALEEGHRSFTIELHTPGGSVNDAWSIHERLRLLNDFCDVQVVVMGICMSAGVSIMMAVPVECRWATKNSEFMLHGGNVMDNSNKLIAKERLGDKERSRLDAVNTRWVIELIAAGTAIARADLVKMVEEEHDVYVPASDAVELGLIAGTL